MSTLEKSIQITPNHPLNFKKFGFSSLQEIKRKNQYSSYNDFIHNVEVLVWNKKNNKAEFQKIVEIKKIEGIFKTYTIKEINNGVNYIANGFITKTY